MAISREDERPRTNPVLVIVLVVAALGAGGFWGYRYYTSSRDTSADLGEYSTEKFELWCTACKKSFMIPATEAKGRRREGRNVECPECKKLTAQWGKPTEAPGGAILP